MQTALEILEKYWDHKTFRVPQDKIIESILEGNDTFALMPTGGGKSICFQIPAMMSDGICLVVSPLIALMKDQVANLQKRNIKAIAMTGGISTNEMIDLLDNCEFGNYKFLYLSPERLQIDWILDRIKNLPINLIAIDEAHCVSQWGHDFRPAYLKINILKTHFPKVPFLALTASATQRVKEDIVNQLGLFETKYFEKSFARDNIAYMVFDVEDKLFRMEQILKKNPESSIIYVRNRKSCTDVSSQLESLGIKTTFYHGGLSMKQKGTNMHLWMTEKVQVMVATNAFGMGIDKANVKTVIHIQLPENIESYYQEAGRAGRNGEKAFAVILSNEAEKLKAESQFLSFLPDKFFLNEMYIKLCNYFRIGYGEGINEKFGFNLNQFCAKYNFPILKTYNAIQFLDRQGILTLSQNFSEKITLQFIIASKEVIRYMSLNSQDEEVILTILRNYPGIYETKTVFDIDLIAKKSNCEVLKVENILEKLKTRGIIEYQSKNNDASIILNEVREDDKTINRVSKFLVNQNKLKKEQFQSVLNYVNEANSCKSKLILSYFGEMNSKNCGICSFCIVKTKKNIDEQSLSQKILGLLKIQDMNSREIEKLTKHKTNNVIFAIKNLLEEHKISIKANNEYTLKS